MSETNQTEPHWADNLPEEVRGWDETKNAQNAEDFWGQMTNHRSMVGRSVQIPTGDASDEARDQFYDRMKQHFPDITRTPDYDNPETVAEVRRRMGMPEEASGYVPPEFDMPEGVTPDETRLEKIRDLAYKNGLTNGQYQDVVKEIISDVATQEAEQNRLVNEEHKSLRDEWGQAYDGKKAQAEKIRKEFFDFIPPEAMNAASIRAMESIATQFGAEHPKLTDTADKVRHQAITPAEARQRAAEIMADKKGPYWDLRSPMHQQTKEKYRKLLEVANS